VLIFGAKAAAGAGDRHRQGHPQLQRCQPEETTTRPSEGAPHTASPRRLPASATLLAA
jgi:hypothetical protein